MEINAYGTIMFLMGSVVGAVVKTFIEFSIRQHFERKEKRKRKEKKARRKAAALEKQNRDKPALEQQPS